MKSSPNVTVWFLEPRLSENTNQQIADLLGSDVSASEERDVKCKDGKKRNMWRVEFALVQKFFYSQHLGKFRVFRSQGSGLPADVTKIIASFFQPKLPKLISVGGIRVEKMKRGSQIKSAKMVAKRRDDVPPPWK
jgi:hypothetical protein